MKCITHNQRYHDFKRKYCPNYYVVSSKQHRYFSELYTVVFIRL